MLREKSKVVWVKTNTPSPERLENSIAILQQMIEVGLKELTGTEDLSAAWSGYFRPRDIVGIKVNCLGGRDMCTHAILAQATVRSLQRTGLAPHQAIVWDRSSRELNRCGFSLNKGKNGAYRCFGTDEKGIGYEKGLTVNGSVGSLYSTLMTRHCTAMINMPVLKDHNLCGLTASLKNVFGALHNPNKYHEDKCNPFVADAYSVPFVREKHRLVICDALRVQYKGGPSFHPQWTEPLGSILLAEDPVAIDRICVNILDGIRSREGLSPIEEDGGVPAYLKTAADPEHQLGRYRLEEIDLEEKILEV
jgi:uncharacterized protein (DUF362 family)